VGAGSEHPEHGRGRQHFRGAGSPGCGDRSVCTDRLSRLRGRGGIGGHLLRCGRQPHATSGGIYGYIEATFGPLTGYVAGTLFWVADLLACGGIAAALADVVTSVVPAPLAPAVHAATIIISIGGIALVNIGGVAHGARLVSAATALKLLPLLIFVVVGAVFVKGANFVQPAAPASRGWGGR